MKVQRTVGAILAVLMVAAVGFAQGPPPITAKIDFAFNALEKALPPGDYTFTRDEYSKVFRVSDGKKHDALVPIITRLALPPSISSEESHLVFDEVGGKYYLSEVWLPGEDGYLVASTPGQHAHKVVPSKR